ncbi:cytochrome b561 and DOMON domain-containing protein At5g47530-like isoform X1 [Quercus lobata]|uniref:cytochrome b561 and DOMON domain-containing protein At5g47530-like isoform X1 n=1 Tax=Quercus lobata TaxID=97700 RepID=UPI001244CA19|nr:cytochrome b561 and DOMON domain-containing protein At5g47530-like isoform X1 [Quercus lobata]
MALTSTPILIICIVISLVYISSAQTCSNYTFSTNQVFNSCIDLPVLQSHLHWNYIPSTRSIQIAYRATQTSTGWIAWAINPTGTSMIGSQAIVAFLNANGTMTAYTTPITSYNPSMKQAALSFRVSNISATYAKNEMTIFGVVGPLNNGTTVNHVWQAGSSVVNNIPQMHPTSGPNIQSVKEFIKFTANPKEN